MLDNNIEIDEDTYLLGSLTKACRVHNDHFTQRLPIQKGMLGVLIKNTDMWFQAKGQPFLSVLYRTLFSTAYFGLFRVGELTTGEHPVKVTDVKIGENKNKFLFILRSSKTHNKDVKPQRVTISSTAPFIKQREPYPEIKESSWCPFYLLQAYRQIRPKYKSKAEPFFHF